MALIAPLIIDRPTNSMPKPAIIPPVFCTASFLANASMNAPMPANVANMTDVDIPPSPNMPKATS